MDGLKNLGIDLSDNIIQQLSDNSLIKQVPIFKTATTLINTTKNITNSIFANKLYLFLFKGLNLSIKDQNQLLKLRDEELSQKILVVLNSYNDLLKCTLLGRVAKKFLLDEIIKEDFIRIGYILDKAIMTDLQYITDIETDKDFEKDDLPHGVCESLLVAGILLDKGAGFDGARFFSLSNSGKILKDLL